MAKRPQTLPARALRHLMAGSIARHEYQDLVAGRAWLSGTFLITVTPAGRYRFTPLTGRKV